MGKPEKSKKCGCLAGSSGPVVKPFVLIHWQTEDESIVSHFCRCRKRVDLIMGVSEGRTIVNQYNLKEKCEQAAKSCTRTIKK